MIYDNQVSKPSNMIMITKHICDRVLVGGLLTTSHFSSSNYFTDILRKGLSMSGSKVDKPSKISIQTLRHQKRMILSSNMYENTYLQGTLE